MTNTALNILVCTKFVIDPNQLQANAEGRPDLARAPFRINTFDENAIEAALQLAGQTDGRVIGVSLVAAPPPKDVMLQALAMGVDTLYLVNDPDRAASDALRVATVLAVAAQVIAESEAIPRWDLLLCGEASVDEINAQVAPRLAAALGLPAVTYATRLEVRDGRLRAERGLEDRAETVEADLPAVATVGMEINDPRMPTVLQIMGAGRKPIKELALRDLAGLDLDALDRRPRLRMLDVFAPPSTRKNVVIDGDSADEIARELLRRLGADGEVKV